MKKDLLRIVAKAPGENPSEQQIENTLAAFQEFLDGYIEVVYYFGDLVIVCNEEGKIYGYPDNFRLGYDIIVGDCIIVGGDLDTGEFRSLTNDEIDLVIKDLQKRAV